MNRGENNLNNQILPNHRWYQDFNDKELGYDQLYGKWLTPLTRDRIALDSFLFINGWLANHQDNYPLTNKISDLFNVFAYDARGMGKSIRSGSMTVKQATLDMNYVLMKALQEKRKLALAHGIDISKMGKIFLMGSCIGGLPIPAAFAAKLPITKFITGTIIISPISKFIPHKLVKPLYFLPPSLISAFKKWFAKPLISAVLSKENASDTKKLALQRVQRIDPQATTRHAREFLWKGNVKDAWKYITVPTILIVGDKDPVAPLEHSIEVYNQLKFPVWLKLNAPSHLILEYNIEYLRVNFLSFTENPMKFYVDNPQLKPETTI